jgi:hypothetical protein
MRIIRELLPRGEGHALRSDGSREPIGALKDAFNCICNAVEFVM